MNDTEVRAVLRAGGIVPPGALVPTDEPIDAVTARTYGHPALGDRVVVRLAPERTAGGTDAELLALGFGAPASSAPVVGLQRRRALGFPGWAIVNDPPRARFALDVVRELRAAAESVRNRPGQANTDFAQIARKLSRSVPHFLPSFWEEVGRTFIGAGNLGLARQAFEKAREAERHGALVVDRVALGESFLEFALAGALSAKSLSGYARSLREGTEPAAAYSDFFNLCVQRSMGGVPPYAGMAKDLRALAKAAGLNLEDCDERMAEALLHATSLSRAPAELWRTYAAAFTRVCARLPSLRDRLASIFPSTGSPYGSENDSAAPWLALLESTGTLTALAAPAEGASGLGAPRAAATFFSRFGGYTGPTTRQRIDLLRRLSPRLLADGEPVSLTLDEDWSPSVDAVLAEVALSLGLRIADPAPDVGLSLSAWAELGAEAPDLTHLSADPRFAALLPSAVDASIGDDAFERAAKGKAALVELRRAWLKRHLEVFETQGLPGMADALETLEERASASMWAEFPDCRAWLERVDAAPVLARTLAAGLSAEWEWIAGEETVAALRGTGKTPERVTIGGRFPHVVLFSRSRAVALGPTGVLATHDLRLPKGAEPRAARYSGGQFLIVFRDEEYDDHGYWSDAPKDTFPVPRAWELVHHDGATLVTSEGLLVEGEGLLRPGARDLPVSTEVFSQGGEVFVPASTETDWDDDDDDTPTRLELRRVDLSTGRAGHAALPPFLAAAAADAALDAHGGTWVVPAPAGLKSSPLGHHDGLLGQRARRLDPRRKASDVVVERVDGLTWRGAIEGRAPAALVIQPGAASPLALAASGWSDELSSWASGEGGPWAVERLGDDRDDDDQPSPLPPQWPLAVWHLLVPRDAVASRILRGLSASQATLLVAHARARRETATEQERDSRSPVLWPLDAVQVEFGTLGDRVIQLAVARQAAYAAELACRVDALIEAASGHAAAGPTVDDADLALAVNALDEVHWPSGDLGAHLSAVVRLLDGPVADGLHSLPETEIPYERWLGRARALAFLSVATGTPTAARVALRSVLEVWTASPLAVDPERLRVVEADFDEAPSTFISTEPRDVDDDPDAPAAVSERWAVVLGASRYLVRRLSDPEARPVRLVYIEHSRAGRFMTPRGAMVQHERRVEVAERPWLQAFLEQVPAGSVLPDTPAVAAHFARAAETSVAIASLVVAGLPALHGWRRDFLDKPVREALGLKVGEAAAGRATLQDLTGEQRIQLLADAQPAEPASLLSTQATALQALGEAFGATWRRVVGQRTLPPDDLVQAAERALAPDVPVRELLAALQSPASAVRFNRDGRWRVDAYGDVERTDGNAPCFDSEALVDGVRTLLWLAGHAPSGEPIRGGSEAFLALIRARLAAPGLIFGLGTWYADGREKKKLRAYFESLQGEPFSPDPKADAKALERGKDSGLLIATLDDEGEALSICWRPSAARTEADFARVRDAARAVETWDRHAIAAAELALSKELGGVATRSTRDQAPAGRYDANPMHSVPDLVDRVAGRLSLSTDAAALYLQLLTLHDPTTRNLQTWNGWKPARLAAVVRELLDRELVVAGKRPRAGREVFLPGAWDARQAPDLPLEGWKAPLFGLVPDEDGDLIAPLGRVLPLGPLERLFHAAWARVEADDGPRWERVR